MNAKIWHNIKENYLNGNEQLLKAANQTLTLTVDKNGNFIFTDMGSPENWEAFCNLAGVKEI